MALHNTENQVSSEALRKMEDAHEALTDKLASVGDYTWAHIDDGVDVTVEELQRLAEFSKLDLGGVVPGSCADARKAFTWARERVEAGSGGKWHCLDKSSGTETWSLQVDSVVDTSVEDVMQRRAETGEVLLRVAYLAHDPDLADPSDPSKLTPNVIADDESHAVFTALYALWTRRCRTLLKPDLSEVINKAYREMERIPGKPEGHIYFVRQSFGEQLRALREVVSNLHRPVAPVPYDPADAQRERTPSRVRVSPVFNDPDALDTLRAESRLGFEAQVEKLRKEVESFRSRNCQEKTLKGGLERVQDLLADLALYEDICQTLVDDLREDAKSLESEIDVMLGVEG